jgi:transposase
MDDKDRFGRLLGIKSPWRVGLVEQDETALTLTIHLRLEAEARLRCPKCAKPCLRYDIRRRAWRHLDTMQFRTIVEADVPRIECADHGVIQISIPWAEDTSRYTALFERHVITWLKDASLSSVARNLGLSWNAVDGIMRRAVARGLARRTSLPPEHLSIDETSFQRRHEYVTVVTEQTTGAVLYVADDRTRESLTGFFEPMNAGDRAGIESVSMDMWPAYISTVTEFVPEAHRRICFDTFHVAQHLGNGVDAVRRAEHKRLSAEGDDRLKGTRYRWLEQPKNMATKHLAFFRSLRDSALATAKAWSIKEYAMCLWSYATRTWAEKAWRTWIAWTKRKGIAPMTKVAEMVDKHLYGIINAIVLKRTNAHAESANARIQKVKSRACGFRNRERFRTAIMFHCGQLDLYPSYERMR